LIIRLQKLTVLDSTSQGTRCAFGYLSLRWLAEFIGMFADIITSMVGDTTSGSQLLGEKPRSNI
jgi:hypothetical protein